MRALPVAGLVLLYCLSACTGQPDPPKNTGASPTQSASATVCENSSTIAARLREYFVAFNQGEDDVADEFFDGSTRFLWYSEIPYREQREPYSAADDPRTRSSLPGYLRQRQLAQETLSLVEVQDNGGGNFGFAVDRMEPGKPTSSIHGKGVIDCGGAKFLMLSIGPGPRV